MSTSQSNSTSSPLADGFYKQHRDRLQEENRNLRDRITYLEGKLRLVASHVERALVEAKP